MLTGVVVVLPESPDDNHPEEQEYEREEDDDYKEGCYEPHRSARFNELQERLEAIHFSSASCLRSLYLPLETRSRILLSLG